MLLGVTLFACRAQSADFSHKLHLKLIPKCVDCHVSVASSTKVEDNNLPPQAACVKCHAAGRALPFPERTQIASFSHQLHLQFGNVSKVLAAAIDKKTYLAAKDPSDIRKHLENNQNACGACHRGLAESDVVSHANLPQMADCLVCHSKIDPPDSCATCHAKSMDLKPANHVEGFFSNHSSGKLNLDKSTCATCHGRRFTCLGCH